MGGSVRGRVYRGRGLQGPAGSSGGGVLFWGGETMQGLAVSAGGLGSACWSEAGGTAECSTWFAEFVDTPGFCN